MGKDTENIMKKFFTLKDISDYRYTATWGAFTSPVAHRHVFYEFTVITSGTCNHSIDGSLPTQLSRGDFYFITPKNTHQLSRLKENSQHRDFYVPAEKMEKICKLFNLDLIEDLPKLSPIFKKKLTESQLVSLEEKATYFNQNLYTFSPEVLEDIHTSIITELLGFIVQTKYEKKLLLPEWIFALVNRIENGDFIFSSIDEIVKTTEFAHGYVCRQFKKYMGKTLLSYNNSIKLRESTNLLKTHTVTQTASILGWDNPKNYNIAFKKVFGITPSQYKKSVKEE